MHCSAVTALGEVLPVEHGGAVSSMCGGWVYDGGPCC